MLPTRFQASHISPGLRSAVSHTNFTGPLRVRSCKKTTWAARPSAPALPYRAAFFSTSLRRRADSPISVPAPAADRVAKETAATTTSQPLPGRVEPKLSLTFTCTVAQCGERSTHEFSKRAYTSGVVLVQCPKCKNRHLIADHLGWFKELTQDGKLPTIEELVKVTGEKIKKGKLNFDGDTEYFE